MQTPANKKDIVGFGVLLCSRAHQPPKGPRDTEGLLKRLLSLPLSLGSNLYHSSKHSWLVITFLWEGRGRALFFFLGP